MRFRSCFFPTFLALWLVFAIPVAQAQPAPLQVAVSVAPQKYLINQIAGERAQVSVLIAAGQTPATWEPTPRGMARLAASDLLFTVGVPFEQVWLPRLQRNFPQLRIVNSAEGIALNRLADHHHHGEHHHSEETLDPHVWLDPLHAIALAENMATALIGIDPQHAEQYRQGLEQLRRQFTTLHQQLRQQLQPFAGRTFMVFHPSWGYFAQRYGLEQLAIEVAGKEPSGAQLSEQAQRARRKQVRVIFIQQQFSQKAAEAIADQIGARIAVLDPLAEDLPAVLSTTAQQIIDALEGPWPQ